MTVHRAGNIPADHSATMKFYLFAIRRERRAECRRAISFCGVVFIPSACDSLFAILSSPVTSFFPLSFLDRREMIPFGNCARWTAVKWSAGSFVSGCARVFVFAQPRNLSSRWSPRSIGSLLVRLSGNSHSSFASVFINTGTWGLIKLSCRAMSL